MSLALEREELFWFWSLVAQKVHQVENLLGTDPLMRSKLEDYCANRDTSR